MYSLKLEHLVYAMQDVIQFNKLILAECNNKRGKEI